VEDRSAVLCHHAAHAKDWERTIDYARRVARTCIARSALADASEKFGLAIAAADQLAPSIEREQAAIDLRIESRMAFSAFGRVDRWLQLAREAEARAEAIGDTPRKVAAMAVRSAALNFHGAAHEAVRAGELSLRQAQALGQAGWINYTRYGLAQACFIAGRYRDAERLLAMTHERLTSADAVAIPGTTVPDMLVLCCMMKAVVHVQTGNLQLADACQREAQALASRSNRPYDLVAAGYATGVYLLAIGNTRAAQTCLRRALALAQEHHVKLFAPVIGCQLGIACFERGDNATARRVLMQAREQAKAVGHVSAMLRASACLALVFATAGKTRMGLRLARQSGRAARAMSFEGIRGQILAFATQIRGPAAAGENVRDLRRSLVIARRNGARPLAAQARRLLAQALRRGAHAQRTSQEGDPRWPR
jgi:tetratricopeptide (TPR) repeat protein